MTQRVYIAGPDVFRTDADAWAASVRALCAAHHYEALVPLDGPAATPPGIYANNVALIRSADAVLANLNPFRGAEPDSGTCFEVGFALALGKRVIGYMTDDSCVAERIARQQGAPLTITARGQLDQDGLLVEDFGLPLNLMLAVPVELVIGDLACALRRLGG